MSRAEAWHTPAGFAIGFVRDGAVLESRTQEGPECAVAHLPIGVIGGDRVDSQHCVVLEELAARAGKSRAWTRSG